MSKPNLKHLPLTGLAWAALAIGASAQGKVWVVDLLNLPGADFTDVQPAVDASAHGDVILIRGRAGRTYGAFQVAGKSLTIAGEPDTSGPFLSINYPLVEQVWIRNLSGGQAVLLRGIVANTSDTTSLTVTDCEGDVLIESSLLQRVESPLHQQPPVPPALSVDRSSSVTVVHTSVTGKDGFVGNDSGAGMQLLSSNVFLQEVQVSGGRGRRANLSSPGAPARAGSAGLIVDGGTLFAAGSMLSGGSGGLGLEDALMNCLPSADGGTGLLVGDLFGAPRVVVLDTALRGGSGGSAPGINCAAGAKGADLEARGAGVARIPIEARSFLAPSPTREGESLYLRFQGRPGDSVFLLGGKLAKPQLDPGFDGALHLNPIDGVRRLGPLPASGLLELALPIGELGLGVEAVTVVLQAVFFSPLDARSVTANPSAVLFLDRAF